MAEVKDGDTVKVHYTGRLSDGAVFDSSEGITVGSFALREKDINTSRAKGQFCANPVDLRTQLALLPGEPEAQSCPEKKQHAQKTSAFVKTPHNGD